MDIGIDWRAIKLFLLGWGIAGLFWIPLTILMMRVLVQMGVGKGFDGKPTLRRRLITLRRWLITV